MVCGDAVRRVLGVVDRVTDEARHVVVLDPVEDLVPLAPGAHHAGHPQLGEMLGDRGRCLAEGLGELVHRTLDVAQRPEQPDPRAVGEHPEDLDGQLDLVVG